MATKKQYALASEMPIYRSTYELMVKTIWAMNGMAKDYKHTIGQKMVDITLEMLTCLQQAHLCQEDRIISIRKFIGLYDNLQQLFKCCSDSEHTGIKAITANDYVNIIPFLSSVYKQAVGWYLSLTTQIQDNNVQSPEARSSESDSNVKGGSTLSTHQQGTDVTNSGGFFDFDERS